VTTTHTSKITMSVKNHYMSLPKGTYCQVTYVWISEDKESLRSKTKTLCKEPAGIKDIPEWFAVSTNITELTLVPVKMFRDPFSLDPNKLVLCEVLDYKQVPAETTLRSKCVEVMEKVEKFEPWFGMEQEYFLLDLDRKPYDWPPGCRFYTGSCCVGSEIIHGRDVATCHNLACLYAGIKICGYNPEAITSQWEFQIGPCLGIEMGDHLWMARYILHRVCEEFKVIATLDVQPVSGHLCPSGGHVNFSTKEMRSEGGLQYIEEAIKKLSRRHSHHLSVYDPHGGADNIRRLNSQTITSSFKEFSSAVAARDVSVRIPGQVFRSGHGYFEDRRPAANCDPYSVMIAMIETCLLGAADDDMEKNTNES
uniref:Glutamine synthetase n=1 Tax=Cynoglossus semilaevis TaxID=244447 RepID=A0A3P8UVW8_CYNSE